MRILVDEQKSPMRVLSVMERSLFGLFPFSSNPGQKPFKSTLCAISASINIFWIKDLHWVKPSYLYVLNPALRQTLNKLSTDILPVVWSIKSWYRSATGCCLDSGTNSTTPSGIIATPKLFLKQVKHAIFSKLPKPLNELTFGKANRNTISYNNELTEDKHVLISKEDNVFYIQSNKNAKCASYLNNRIIKQKKLLNSGDLIFVNNIKISMLIKISARVSLLL